MQPLEQLLKYSHVPELFFTVNGALYDISQPNPALRTPDKARPISISYVVLSAKALHYLRDIAQTGLYFIFQVCRQEIGCSQS